MLLKLALMLCQLMWIYWLIKSGIDLNPRGWSRLILNNNVQPASRHLNTTVNSNNCIVLCVCSAWSVKEKQRGTLYCSLFTVKKDWINREEKYRQCQYSQQHLHRGELAKWLKQRKNLNRNCSDFVFNIPLFIPFCPVIFVSVFFRALVHNMTKKLLNAEVLLLFSSLQK